jgi:late competence protein required for DNA uptake (superfamily II DNA/RNA helicase)
MDKNTEFELFKRLCREPKLKEWLQFKLDQQVQVLISAEDVRAAQGQAKLLKSMMDLLDAAKAKL